MGLALLPQCSGIFDAKFSKASNFHVVRFDESIPVRRIRRSQVAGESWSSRTLAKESARAMGFRTPYLRIVYFPELSVTTYFLVLIFGVPCRPKARISRPPFCRILRRGSARHATTQEKLDNVDGRYEADELADALEHEGYDAHSSSSDCPRDTKSDSLHQRHWKPTA